MELKYYTPELEEFHEGFEYEFRPRLRDGIMSYIDQTFRYVDYYKKQTIGKEASGLLETLEDYNDPFSIQDVLSYHKDNAIRIKYIDEEDILSLKWEIDDKKEPIGYFGFDIWVIRPFVGTKLFEIFKEDKLRFSGTIKNKSELKRLMNQLGICK